MLRALLEDLKAQRTFRFEEPWRLSSRALGLAVPIVRKEYGERRYVLLDEVPGAVDIRDSGEIRKLIARSNVDKPVFIRGGIMFKGATQPRAVRFGIVILPREKRPMEVLCVHDVRPIRPSARLRPSLDVPARVMARVMEGSQAAVWEEIRGLSLALEMRAMPLRRPVMRLITDLTEITESLELARRDIGEVIEKFPLIKDQVGVVILDAKGVYALELFDHPDSWSAIAKNAGRKFAEVLAEESDYEIFKPDKEGIVQAIEDFLDKLGACEEHEVFKNRIARTRLLRGEGIHGEYTILEGSVIHLLAIRVERPSPLISFLEEPVRFFELESRPRSDRTVRTLLEVLRALEASGKPWSELEEQLRGRMSTATLSKRLKNGLKHGLVVKSLRENGRVIYELTAKGKALLEQIRENEA